MRDGETFDVRRSTVESIARGLESHRVRGSIRDADIVGTGRNLRFRVTFDDGTVIHATRREAYAICHALASAHYAESRR